MMRSVIIGAGCLPILAVAAMLVAAAERSPHAKRGSAVTQKEIEERGVVGQLGPRLGTIVEVSGKVVPNTSRAKADVGRTVFPAH